MRLISVSVGVIFLFRAPAFAPIHINNVIIIIICNNVGFVTFFSTVVVHSSALPHLSMYVQIKSKPCTIIWLDFKKWLIRQLKQVNIHLIKPAYRLLAYITLQKHLIIWDKCNWRECQRRYWMYVVIKNVIWAIGHGVVIRVGSHELCVCHPNECNAFNNFWIYLLLLHD